VLPRRMHSVPNLPIMTWPGTLGVIIERWGGNARFLIRDKRTDAAWSVCLHPPMVVTLEGVDLMCCRAATTHLLAAPALQWLCRWEKSRFETGS
jgi:hypothetical protein